MLIDSHCHLSSDEIYCDLENVIRRAQESGVYAFLNIGAKPDTFDTQIEICHRFKNVWTTVGVHPHDALEYQDVKASDLLLKTVYPEVVAIGECGLDYYYDFAPKDAQIKVFKEMIKTAQESGLPLIVHTRDAEDDTITLLTDYYKQKPFKGVIHCYSSSLKLAKEALNIGFYISASGMITFKNSGELRDNFKYIPLERLLLETDTPYLAPVPYRGRVNEPAYILQTAKMLAEIKELDFEKISAITTENFKRLFDKARVLR